MIGNKYKSFQLGSIHSFVLLRGGWIGGTGYGDKETESGDRGGEERE